MSIGTCVLEAGAGIAAVLIVSPSRAYLARLARLAIPLLHAQTKRSSQSQSVTARFCNVPPVLKATPLNHPPEIWDIHCGLVAADKSALVRVGTI